MVDCGLTNLASCIPQKIAEHIEAELSAPIQSLLNFVKALLTEPVNISLFSNIWVIIIYTLSLVYGLLFVYSGFNFIISGYDVERREKAKEWFRNTLIMIVMVQTSYFLYEMIIDVGSLLATGVLGMVDEQLFLFNADSIVSVGSNLIFYVPYVVVLLITIILLIIRYIIVSIGVVFFPLGIFLYFIPPLRNYGTQIISALMVNILIPFVAGIILIACAKLTELSLFLNFRLMIMTAAFLLVDVAIIYLLQSFKNHQQRSETTTMVLKKVITAIV